MAVASACRVASAQLAPEPSERRGVELGAAAEFLWGPFSTLSGPWFGFGPAIDIRWRSVFHVRLKPLAVAGRTSRDTARGYPAGQTDASTMVVGGAFLRAMPALDIGSLLVARFGPVAAVLSGSYESSLCGDVSYRDAAIGGSAEFGARLGARSQYEFGAQFDFIPLTPPRCKNQPPPPNDPVLELPPRNEPEDNVGIFVGATATYVFAQ